MPPDQPPASAEPRPIEAGSVVDFGMDENAARQPRGPHFSVSFWAASLAADRRVVPVAATLGGVALFASSVSEWQVTKVDASLLSGSQVGMHPLPTTIADLGAWGAGYLVGVFTLVASTVLVLFGPAPGRRYARLIGLSFGGSLIALLAGAGSELDDSSRTLGQFVTASVTAGQVEVSYGRGLWCALVGVAAVMLALILAGRHLMPPDDSGAPATDDVESPAEGVPPVWSWRRPRSTGEEDDERRPEEPFDLTVSSAKPFTPSSDDRDKPN